MATFSKHDGEEGVESVMDVAKEMFKGLWLLNCGKCLRYILKQVAKQIKLSIV